MLPTDLADLDAAQALDLADRVDAAADAAETTRLRVAQRWADLHGCLDDQGGDAAPGRCLPGRRSHRVKTHGRWKVWQIDDGAFLWKAPHGHCYLVDPDGTHPVQPARTPAPATTPART